MALHCRHLASSAGLAAGLWALLATSAVWAGTPLEASIRHLREAVTSQRDGSHLGMLLALRQLRDPALEPVFTYLLTHREWQVQVHAVLGLAETSRSGRIDPAQIAQIGPLAQEAAIASALDQGLLGPQEIPELLAPSQVSPMARLLLYAELISLGEEVDRETLRLLSEDSEYRVSCLASLLLAQIGEGGPLEAMCERLRDEGRAGTRKLLWMMDAIRQYRLTATERWVRMLLAQDDLDTDLTDAAVLAAITLDPVRNIDLWHDALGASPSLARRVRYGLMLLHAGGDVPASAYERIAGDGELTSLIAAAGVGVSTNVDASSAMIELLDFGHVRAMEWVIEAAGGLSEAEARRVYVHVLDRLGALHEERDPRRRGPLGEWIAASITAASRLYELNPHLANEKLLASKGEGPVREALLLGALESGDPSAGAAAARLELSGFTRSESLAMLLIAKHAESLDAEQMRRLGLIASGGGRLSAELRAQAAWLYVKRSGEVVRALREILE